MEFNQRDWSGLGSIFITIDNLSQNLQNLWPRYIDFNSTCYLLYIRGDSTG